MNPQISDNGHFDITFVGHATLLIEIDGVRILTDPLLRSRVAHLGRLVDVPDISDVNIDAILISHMHWDHFDLPSLRLLGYDKHIIVPRGAGSHLRKKGFRWVEEIGRYEMTRLGKVIILATPAEHSGNSPFLGPNVDSLGFLIRGSREVYFAGDTDLFPEMEVLSDSTDVALIPVWGYGPTLGAGHLDPYRAAKALPGIDPKMAIPIHWGTYCPIGMVWMQMAFTHYPPHSFQRYAKSMAPHVEVLVLEPGQSLFSVENQPKMVRSPTSEKLESWQDSKLMKWQAKRYKGSSAK